MDFYDLKGCIDTLLEGLHISDSRYESYEHPSFHPGKCGSVYVGERKIGVLGELHPLVRENYDLPDVPLAAAELDLEAIFAAIPEGYTVQPVPLFPSVLEDLAVVVEESVLAEQVEAVIRRAAGDLLVDLRLFDLFRGAQVGEGRKSLAYALAYQAPDRTLTDDEVAKIRARVIEHLESELGAKLRT
jgi:phenylalanyl-tRNA synthetase beta chain